MIASLATALVTHWLQRDARREAAREEFERERMAAWARLDCEILEKAYLGIDDLQQVLTCVLGAFMPVMHFIDTPAREEISAAIGDFTDLLEKAMAEEDSSANLGCVEETANVLGRLHAIISKHHEEESERFFRTHSHRGTL